MKNIFNTICGDEIPTVLPATGDIDKDLQLCRSIIAALCRNGNLYTPRDTVEYTIPIQTVVDRYRSATVWGYRVVYAKYITLYYKNNSTDALYYKLHLCGLYSSINDHASHWWGLADQYGWAFCKDLATVDLQYYADLLSEGVIFEEDGDRVYTIGDLVTDGINYISTEIDLYFCVLDSDHIVGRWTSFIGEFDMSEFSDMLSWSATELQQAIIDRHAAQCRQAYMDFKSMYF